MEGEGWRERLRLAVDASGKSQRAISIAAGMGAGYVNSLFKDGKDPTIENLIKVCGIVGVSLSYVLYGIEISPETEETLKLLQKAPEDERNAWLALLRMRHGRAR